MKLGQDMFAGEPPFARLPLSLRWQYSELVCTGVANPPQRTGRVERIGDRDRDQLSARVNLQTCYKGTPPNGPIVVLGDSLWAEKELIGVGIVGSGPPTGFLAGGRNLLFLRKTDSPAVWRVTVPVYQCAIPLAGTAPHYKLDGSENSLREALGAEFLAVIRQGYVGGDGLSFPPSLKQPESSVVWIYSPYLFDVYGFSEALDELAALLSDARPSIRRAVAVELLLHGDQRGVPETIALLQDKTAIDYGRSNAARALGSADSPQAEAALWLIAREPINDPLHRVVREVLENRLRR
jgi:hypothetical protein